MSKINYFARKDELRKRAKRWTDTMEFKYHHDILSSITNTIEYPKDFILDDIQPRYEESKFTFLKMDSVSAIFKVSVTTDKVCVLNFASYKNPGGQFLNGSSAQEECLCHESFLYNVLKEFNDSYYKTNRKNTNRSLYNDNLLYSKFILFMKEQGIIPCDVITCAAPNRNSAVKYYNMDINTIHEAMMSRLNHIFQAAYHQNVDILILGAFGCGVFGNSITDVSHMMYILLNSTYKNCFKEVVFAIPECHGSDTTFQLFKDSFNRYQLDKGV